MNQKIAQIRYRRAVLIERAAAQRDTLADRTERLKTPLKIVDAGYRALVFLRRYPVIAGAVAFASLHLGHTRLRHAPRLAWGVWRLRRWLVMGSSTTLD